MHYFDEKYYNDYSRECAKEGFFIITLKLDETPRVGDIINIPITDGLKYSRGIVYEVEHTINGHEHHIEILAHPSKGEYERWLRLKENYEDHERWLRRIRDDY